MYLAVKFAFDKLEARVAVMHIKYFVGFGTYVVFQLVKNALESKMSVRR